MPENRAGRDTPGGGVDAPAEPDDDMPLADLAAALAAGLAAVGASAVAVYSVEPDDSLQLVGSAGLPAPMVSAWRRVSGQLTTAAVDAARRAEPLWLPDLDAARRRYVLIGDPDVIWPSRAMIPVRGDERPVAVVGVFWDEEQRFPPDRRAAVTAVVDDLADADRRAAAHAPAPGGLDRRRAGLARRAARHARGADADPRRGRDDRRLRPGGGRPRGRRHHRAARPRAGRLQRCRAVPHDRRQRSLARVRPGPADRSAARGRPVRLRRRGRGDRRRGGLHRAGQPARRRSAGDLGPPRRTAPVRRPPRRDRAPRQGSAGASGTW